MGKQVHLPATDLTRWRLHSHEGDHEWRYLNAAEASDGSTRPQTFAERYLLGLTSPSTPPLKSTSSPTHNDTTKSPFTTPALAGFHFLTQLQLPEGHWACDYGGPSFLLPGLVFAMYITRTPIPEPWRIEMTRYLASRVNPDGGWGLHHEGRSTVFATGLYYVMLRLLGMGKGEPLVARARECLLGLGGVTGIPQWGKIWLSCLNLYEWDGVNCIPVDLWLLPSWLPFHPSRWWVQCRVVYLPTSYLWSNRCTAPLDDLLTEIREEIYTTPYSAVNFRRHCSTAAPSDTIRSVSGLLLFLFSIIAFWCNYLRPRWLLRMANRRVGELMRREERNTDYNCLAPVNKAFHMVCALYEDGPDSERLRRHRERLAGYLWLGQDGMTSGGTNGAQLWDTVFTVQAAVEAGLADDPTVRASLAKAHHFLDITQLRDDLDDPFRQGRKGGWPFSTRSNGYIVSDCAAEGLKAVLMLQKECGFPALISDARLADCVDTLLAMQNADGGFGSYEQTRGSRLLEYLNPAEVFDDIMIEYSYVECTTAVLTALARFRTHISDHRSRDIEAAMHRAAGFVAARQRPDGSWYGSWAICFTYATFFAVQAFEARGLQHDSSEEVRRACAFLLAKQRDDGGWGEHYSSCVEKRYIEHETSQVVNTAWAVMALMHAGYPDPEPVQRGLKLIADRQQPSGEWLQEGVEGVFNRSCMIGYPNYKLYFTVMALGVYSRMYLPKIQNHRD